VRELLVGSTLVTSFLGGVVALLAPCCASVMLPAYFATSLRHRFGLVAMTLVFGAGVATVILPIVLGASALSVLLAAGQRQRSQHRRGRAVAGARGRVVAWSSGRRGTMGAAQPFPTDPVAQQAADGLVRYVGVGEHVEQAVQQLLASWWRARLSATASA